MLFSKYFTDINHWFNNKKVSTDPIFTADHEYIFFHRDSDLTLTHICYQFSFNISTHVPTQVHWWMSIMFTQSAQWWKYLLCLKTLQRPGFLVACWVQTGQFQIWPVPTSQGYKSMMLSLIEMIFEMKITSDIAEFQESQVVL